MKTIYLKDTKNQTLAIQTVRALLKNNGFKMGASGTNGRIKGMSEFYGGNLEVKGNEFAWDLVENTLDSGTITRKFVIASNVVVCNHNYLGKKEDMSKVLKVLKNAGYVTKVIKKSGDVVVDNKK